MDLLITLGTKAAEGVVTKVAEKTTEKVLDNGKSAKQKEDNTTNIVTHVVEAAPKFDSQGFEVGRRYAEVSFTEIDPVIGKYSFQGLKITKSA
jgi:hypothetical protein